VDLDEAHLDKNNWTKFHANVCLLVMGYSKTRASIVNLLDAFGICTEFVDTHDSNVSPASFAIVDASAKRIELARSIQQQTPNCRCIVLTSVKAPLDRTEVQKQIKNPIFMILPFTVSYCLPLV
jgi:hypothetical protein